MPAAMIQLTAARLTSVGRGAVATIGVRTHVSRTTIDVSPSNEARGNSIDQSPFAPLNSLFQAANHIPLSEQKLKKIAFGQWGEMDAEDLVVCRISEQILEIHCHGGEAAVQRILNDLSNAGCAVIDWREQVAATGDVVDVECLDVLSRTSTWRTTRIALEQSNGLLKSAFSKLAAFEATAEGAFERHLDSLLQWASFGLHLAIPWSVVLTGRPNVGKSSLINALLGYQRAIVFDEPGTTRDVVTGETAFDGWPVTLADTAGIRDNAGGLEAAGIALARERLRTADLRLVLVDLSQPPTKDDEQMLSESTNAIVVAHKSDLANQWGDCLPGQAVRVSSVTGEGLMELQRRLVDRLVPSVPNSGTPIPITERQVVALKKIWTSTTSEERRRAVEELFGAT